MTAAWLIFVIVAVVFAPLAGAVWSVWRASNGR